MAVAGIIAHLGNVVSMQVSKSTNGMYQSNGSHQRNENKQHRIKCKSIK